MKVHIFQFYLNELSFSISFKTNLIIWFLICISLIIIFNKIYFFPKANIEFVIFRYYVLYFVAKSHLPFLHFWVFFFFCYEVTCMKYVVANSLEIMQKYVVAKLLQNWTSLAKCVCHIFSYYFSLIKCFDTTTAVSQK